MITIHNGEPLSWSVQEQIENDREGCLAAQQFYLLMAEKRIAAWKAKPRYVRAWFRAKWWIKGKRMSLGEIIAGEKFE